MGKLIVLSLSAASLWTNAPFFLYQYLYKFNEYLKDRKHSRAFYLAEEEQKKNQEDYAWGEFSSRQHPDYVNNYQIVQGNSFFYFEDPVEPKISRIEQEEDKKSGAGFDFDLTSVIDSDRAHLPDQYKIMKYRDIGPHAFLSLMRESGSNAYVHYVSKCSRKFPAQPCAGNSAYFGLSNAVRLAQLEVEQNTESSNDFRPFDVRKI